MFCVIWREFKFSEPVLRNVSVRLLFWLGGNWGEGEISWIHCHGPYNPWKFDETFFCCVGASWYERHVPHFNRWPPSVNLKFYDVFKDTCLDWIFHSPIDNGICSLHVIHGAFRPGAEASGWKLKSSWKCSHKILHDAPACTENYTSIILLWHSLDWQQEGIWSSYFVMGKHYCFIQVLGESPQEEKAIFLKLCKCEKGAWRWSDCEQAFFSFVASLMEPYLRKYQCDKPMSLCSKIWRRCF